ncbi:MAG: radical SAM protein [Bacteroidales bacterium]|nr:radical SAM protein [Bacteroidales bacterium]MDY0140892.1 radical SAM protein [Bacteroidales bacterium]
MFNSRKRKLIKKYNLFRDKPKHYPFCNAPSAALRFHRNGGVQICCHHIDFLFLKDKSLKDIWFGQELTELRNQMKSYNIPKSCSFCSSPFFNSNFSNVNAISFDYLECNSDGYPVLMDFSLENTCNLQCIMCDASLSSAIAKQKGKTTNSDKYLYDSSFVKQLTEFLPHLKYAVFTGGEPFLINSYFPIWEKMIEINPEIIINITTNGTIFNPRIEDVLKKGKFNLTVSFDSFVPEIYNLIRKGADFETSLANVFKFAAYCKSANTQFTITICPMQINKMDVPNIMRKCNLEGWNFTYNIVLKPWNLALWSLSSDNINDLILFYKNEDFGKIDNQTAERNIVNYNSLISLLEEWLIKILNFERNAPSASETQVLRNELILVFNRKLSLLPLNKFEIGGKDVFDQIPAMLIKPELLNYLEYLNAQLLLIEIENNDIDTIIDHLCIVAFNL